MDLYDDKPAADDCSPGAQNRPYIGVYFECCGVYVRIYRAPGADRYSGRCPRCGATVTAQVGSNGTTQRIFHAR